MKAKKKMTETEEGHKAQAPQLDEAFVQAAQARLLVDAEKRNREQRCGQEINAAIAEITKRCRCIITFVEMRQSYPQPNGEVAQSIRMGIHPIAQDEPITQ